MFHNFDDIFTKLQHFTYKCFSKIHFHFSMLLKIFQNLIILKCIFVEWERKKNFFFPFTKIWQIFRSLICEINENFGEFGIYDIIIDESKCQTIVRKEAVNIYFREYIPWILKSSEIRGKNVNIFTSRLPKILSKQIKIFFSDWKIEHSHR